jgi:D-glycero-alpha-D-manno-heptose-7-phosphate kinase
MIKSTEAQERPHPGLVGSEARHVIAIAREHGASGWWVSGAGGEGGAVTLLCGAHSHRMRALVREIEKTSPAFRSIPVHLSRRALRAWRRDLGPPPPEG